MQMPGSVQVLPNGNVLVPLLFNGKVAEYDAAGQIVWEANVQQPSSAMRLPNGHTLIATLLSTGEFPLGLVYAHRIEEMKTKGAAVDWTPLDPIIVTPNLVAMGKNTAHPNAAKLFIDFLLSVEGQTILQKQQYRTPANPELPPLSPKMDPKKLKLLVADKRIADQHEKFAKTFYDLFVRGKAEP